MYLSCCNGRPDAPEELPLAWTSLAAGIIITGVQEDGCVASSPHVRALVHYPNSPGGSRRASVSNIFIRPAHPQATSVFSFI